MAICPIYNATFKTLSDYTNQDFVYRFLFVVYLKKYLALKRKLWKFSDINIFKLEKELYR